MGPIKIGLDLGSNKLVNPFMGSIESLGGPDQSAASSPGPFVFSALSGGGTEATRFEGLSSAHPQSSAPSSGPDTMLSWKRKARAAGTSNSKEGSLKVIGGKRAYKEGAVRASEDCSRKKDRKTQVRDVPSIFVSAAAVPQPHRSQ